MSKEIDDLLMRAVAPHAQALLDAARLSAMIAAGAGVDPKITGNALLLAFGVAGAEFAAGLLPLEQWEAAERNLKLAVERAFLAARLVEGRRGCAGSA